MRSLKTLFSTKDQTLEPENSVTTRISNHFTKEIDFETEHYHDVQKRICPGDVEEEPAKFSYETFPQKSLEKYQCTQDKFLEVQNR